MRAVVQQGPAVVQKQSTNNWINVQIIMTN